MALETAYFNRELSWLRFNARVLWEAERASLPLLERVKFLAISASNLDEFFMVRVGGLRTLLTVGRRTKDIAGLTPRQQLERIRREVRDMYGDQYRIWETDLEPALGAQGIVRRKLDQLDADQIRGLKHHFEEHLLPLLTPVAVDPESPAFRIPGRKLCALFQVGESDQPEDQRLVVVAVPANVARFVRVDTREGFHFVVVEDLVERFADEFFPAESIRSVAWFRLTRNGDIAVSEEYAPDLTEAMEDVLAARKFSDTVRLETLKGTPRNMLSVLRQLTGAESDCCYTLTNLLDLSALMALYSLSDYERLRSPLWKPQPLVALQRGQSIFEILQARDLLLHHPYDSFEPVARLLEEAAVDPEVVAVKQVLYRTARDSRIISALIRAAEQGKQVTVLIELKARFDEARNLDRAEELELAGAQVVYGIRGLKTHAKASLVIRRESGRMRRYVHFGTGNYNEATAKLYTDISYLTSRSDYGTDAAAFFNGITGRSQMIGLQKLRPAPTQMKKTLLRMIAEETKRARGGESASIKAKMNSLQDREVIDALYVASQAGVVIRLMVRGICCLRAGVPKLSENIEVHSLIDHYLEHARIFYFHNGGDPKLYISSADWMHRNLEKRIELMIPIEDRGCREKLIHIVDMQFKDNVQAWKLLPDGTYGPAIDGKHKRFRVQEYFTQLALEQRRKEEEGTSGVFELHLPPSEAKEA